MWVKISRQESGRGNFLVLGSIPTGSDFGEPSFCPFEVSLKAAPNHPDQIEPIFGANRELGKVRWEEAEGFGVGGGSKNL